MWYSTPLPYKLGQDLRMTPLYGTYLSPLTLHNPLDPSLIQAVIHQDLFHCMVYDVSHVIGLFDVSLYLYSPYIVIVFR